MSNLSLDMWELLEALRVGVLAVGNSPVSLEEVRGHEPGTERMRVPHSSPGWGAVR